MSGRELMFCASSARCNAARMVEKGTLFYCSQHRSEEAVASEATAGGPDAPLEDLEPGMTVLAKDRRNHGVVLAVEGTMATVRFADHDRGTTTEVKLSTAWLEKA
jgi:hypothetical protein